MAFTLFIIGLLASLLASMPLGMLNLTAIEIGSKGNAAHVARFSVGAASIEFFLALLAVTFSAWFIHHEKIFMIFNITVIPVLLTLSFLYLKKNSKPTRLTKKFDNMSPLGRAVSLALLNPVALIFWTIFTSFIMANFSINIEGIGVFALVSGISLGTFTVLFLYGRLSKILVQKIPFVRKQLNLIIGTAFMVIAVLHCVRLCLL